MNWTNVRAKIGALVAVVVILIMLAALAAYKGYNIPVISDIVNSFNG